MQAFTLVLAGLLLLFALPQWLSLPAISGGDLASAASGLTLGLALRLVWFLAGLAPGLLAASGLVLWWT